MLEFAERHLDRVKVRRVLRQILQCCASSFDGLLHARNFMGWKVVYHHDVAALERRCQALLDVGHEDTPLIGPSRTIGATILLCRRAATNVIVFPSSLRIMADQSLATRATSPETDHIDAGRSLIDKHQSRRIKKALLPNPTAPRSRHVRSVLLGCPQAFFERDAMTIEESPERAAAARNPSLVHRRYKLVQRSVRLLINRARMRWA